MIAMKREVATACVVGFPWSECQVRKLATSHCITRESAKKIRSRRKGMCLTHPVTCTVTACRTKIKCEKEATFFMASQVMRITLKA